MAGRTVVEFRCPCSDVEAPANHSFWVEIVGLPGFPPLLYGSRFRCRDKWVALFKAGLIGQYSVKRFIEGRNRSVEGICGPVVDTVRATWELEDLSAEEAQEAEELTQRVVGE